MGRGKYAGDRERFKVCRSKWSKAIKDWSSCGARHQTAPTSFTSTLSAELRAEQDVVGVLGNSERERETVSDEKALGGDGILPLYYPGMCGKRLGETTPLQHRMDILPLHHLCAVFWIMDDFRPGSFIISYTPFDYTCLLAPPRLPSVPASTLALCPLALIPHTRIRGLPPGRLIVLPNRNYMDKEYDSLVKRLRRDYELERAGVVSRHATASYHQDSGSGGRLN